MFNTDVALQNYEHLLLSFRGAERQRPSVIVQAMRFQKIYLEKKDMPEFTGRSVEDCLNRIIDGYNSHKGIDGVKRFQITRDQRTSVLNLVTGTDDTTKQLIMGHLNFTKWTDSGAPSCLTSCLCKLVVQSTRLFFGRFLITCACFKMSRVPAFNEQLMKSKRWLLTARPRVPEAPNWEHLLTVSAEVQELFISRVILSFNARARKVKSNCRARVRWSPEEWDKNVDFAALTVRVLERARQTSCSPSQLDAVKAAFFAGWLWYVYDGSRQPCNGCRIMPGEFCNVAGNLIVLDR